MVPIVGLYRDDRLSVFRNISGQQAEKQKDNSKIFQRQRQKAIIKSLKIGDYLVATINLNDGRYRPFYKPNEETIAKTQIFHRKLPKRSIEKRFSRLLQQRKYLKFEKITMGSVYSNADITKN